MTRWWPLPRLFSFALVAGTALSLTACATNKTPPPPCPEILIPIDGSQLTRFQPGPGRDIIDIMHEEVFSGFAHGCEYNIDSTGVGSVTVSIAPSFESKRGPANPNNQAQFEYYVAVVDQDKAILDKKRFPATITFPSNMSRVLWQRAEPINLTIPLVAGKTGENFQIFIGLQLTREELEYQRKIR